MQMRSRRRPVMPDINKSQLLRHIAASDLTAVEKRHLEGLVRGKHGQWLINCDGYYPYCSRCGHEPAKMTKYCGGCGAEMDGGVDDA